MKPTACQCGRVCDWYTLNWELTVPGYKVKVYKCECGNEMTKFVPASKEKIKIWKGLENLITGD